MKKILILDDDREFRAELARLLSARGYQPSEAETGQAGSVLVGATEPELIVVDGLLPDTDGMTWIQRLRSAGNMTPVVFASAFWKDHGTLNGLTSELGAIAVVQKPVAPHQIAEKIDAHFLNTGTSEALTATKVEGDYAEGLAELQREYAGSLPGKVAAIERVLDGVRAAQPGACEELRLLSHRLRGTAGSYGFDEISDAAGRIEEAIRRVLRDEGHAAGDLSTLEAQTTRLRELVAAALRAPGQPALEAAGPVDRVLVADADSSFVAYVQELARRYAVEIIPAQSPQAALEAARSRVPDAVVLDVGLDGDEAAFEVARKLRELPHGDALPIAFISARDSVQVRVAAAHAGGSLFLRKPFDVATLGDALQQLLSERSGRPRVLLLDDDPDFQARIASTLRREGMELLALDEPHQLLVQLERFRPDLILLGMLMPQVDGFDICRMLRTSPAWRDVPVLFMASHASVETRIAAFRAGADDYLVKPILPEELLARIDVRLERARLLNERSDRDALTGLSLRRPFLSRLAAYLTDAHRKEQPVSICFIDLDHFKQVNDTHGHLAGDRVLATFGRLLSTRFRANDLRARWGGEEFMLCFPGEPVETTTAIIERVLEEAQRLTFESDTAERFAISFSAGVASFPADGDSVQDLVRVADRRLYAAKRGGRGRIVSNG